MHVIPTQLFKEIEKVKLQKLKFHVHMYIQKTWNFTALNLLTLQNQQKLVVQKKRQTNHHVSQRKNIVQDYTNVFIQDVHEHAENISHKQAAKIL